MTRITTGGIFYSGTSTPYWIFTNVDLASTVPIAVDGSGDADFTVTAIQAIIYGGQSYTCFVLNNSASWAYYEVNTGILIQSYFVFGPSDNYTINLNATNVFESPPEAPASPTLDFITPDPCTTGIISLTWSSSSGAINYYIYRSTSPITSPTGATLVTMTCDTSTQDTPPGIGIYYYAIVAANSGGMSLISNYQSVDVQSPPPPAPTLDAILPNPSTTGAITLSWSTSTGATSYSVYNSTDFITDLSGATLAGITAGTSFQVTIITDGTYYYVVVASNSEGDSLISNCQSIVVTLPCNYTMVVGSPYNWIDASAGGTQLFLDDDGTSTQQLPFSFSYYASNFQTVYVSANGWLSFQNSDPYDYSNAPYPTATSNYAYAIAPFWDDLNPGQSGDQTYVENGSNYWVMEWANVNHYSSGPLVGTFEVILLAGGTIIFQYSSISYTEGGYTCGLNFGDGYLGNSYAGLSDTTINLAIAFSPEIYPAVPALAAISPNPNMNGLITLAWSGSTGADAYEVYRSNDPISPFTGVTLVATTSLTSAQDSVPANGTYFYVVTASNSTGTSLISNCQSVTVQVPPPLAPTLSAITPNPSTTGVISITWTDSINATIYYVYRDTSPITSTAGLTPVESTGANTTQDIVPMNGTYYYAVVAGNIGGNSPISNSQDVTVQVTPPLAPTLAEITPNPSSNGSITLTWSTCTGAMTYYIFRDTNLITSVSGLVPIKNIDETTFQDTVTTNGTYYYAIVAGNVGGNSSVSNCQNVTVQIIPRSSSQGSSGSSGTSESSGNNGTIGLGNFWLLFLIVGVVGAVGVVVSKGVEGRQIFSKLGKRLLLSPLSKQVPPLGENILKTALKSTWERR